MGRPPRTSAEVGTQASEGPTWSKWDLGKALKGLRSASPAVRLQTLRQIHTRLWHAPARRMRDLLKAAGLSDYVLNEVQQVVDTCSSCREWQRRTNRPMTSLTLTSRFNEAVQFDLLYLEDKGIVAHICCMCIRWAQGEFVKDREPHTCAVGH